ncbi:hypothetical protein OG298_01060 [Streptomyces sp. NBC_01005]|uniref:hypothetical protein n=1 Tax=unclassified Streptomyces TaxID=2593676 RepID=UPI002E37DD2E|nr:hypothetical protein [Streptomyces sp. NBC_01362]WSW03068.1 hypothetical protein OG298_01060 [Streptomyces sp. NBC_01005]WTC92574.1 hypothetical protein OH736_01065 [Streptomyces sp. NBC_01650]
MTTVPPPGQHGLKDAETEDHDPDDDHHRARDGEASRQSIEPERVPAPSEREQGMRENADAWHNDHTGQFILRSVTAYDH